MSDINHIQVVLSGLSGEQVINNILYYRCTATDVDAENEAGNFGVAVAADFVPTWLNCMSVHYTLVALHTQMFDSGWTPQLFLPHQTPINDTGNVSGNLAGPAQVAIIKFFLDAGSAIIPTGTTRLKRSYLAMGPVPEAAVQDTGEFDGTPYPSGALDGLLGLLATEQATSGDIGSALPERVGAPITAGIRASMLVSSAAFRALSSFRRSRIGA